MATTVTDSGLVKLLQDLVHLDYDAIRAYEAAIDRLEDDSFKSTLARYCADHRAHTENLGAHLRALGADVPDGADWKKILTKGKVVIAGLIGDRAILAAMLANEEVTNKAYEAALEHEAADPGVQQTLRANLEDERRHRAWIEGTLERL
ncbi:DUF892 family protein [Parasphingopyxis marina]|uniref:DUF892 family protein n=1 Tax=Parasphingopyxis marina TaxID=2761622 RepID=A0A842HZP3_9SPHN|nr:DUF892 family protein [Parasphingopyxis marina]MBC2778666.1 DUF892 family protein [Parasphingopyxis marina]